MSCDQKLEYPSFNFQILIVGNEFFKNILGTTDVLQLILTVKK